MKTEGENRPNDLGILVPLLCSVVVLLVLSCAPLLASSLAVQPLNNCTSHCCICYWGGLKDYCTSDSGGYPDCNCDYSGGSEDLCSQNIPPVAGQ